MLSTTHEQSYSAIVCLWGLFVSAGNSRVFSTTQEQTYSAVVGLWALFVSAGYSHVLSVTHAQNYSAIARPWALFVSAGNSRVLSRTHEQSYSAILGLKPSWYQRVIPVCFQLLMERATQHPRAFVPSSSQRVTPV